MRTPLSPLRLIGVCALVLACSEDKNSTTTGGSDGSGGSAGAAALDFCDVEPILVAKCHRCHGDPPRNGAPFSLMSASDVRGPSTARRPEQMLHALESDFMPATWLDLDPPVEPLTCDEKLTLMEWLEAGDLADPTRCDTDPPQRSSCR